MASKFHLLKHHKTPTTTSATTSLLRRLCTAATSPQPPQSSQNPTVTEAIKLLEPPNTTDWNTPELLRLLFPPNQPVLLQITRNLGSSKKSLDFLHWLHTNKPHDLENTHFLSCPFQCAFKSIARKPSSEKALFELFEKAKEWNVGLTLHAGAMLLKSFARAGMVDEAASVYGFIGEECRDAHVRNSFIDVLLKVGRVRDALNVVVEMLEMKEGKFGPNENTVDIVFGGLLRVGDSGASVIDEEISELVLKFGELGFFLSSARLTRLINELCRNRKTSRAWDVLIELMKFDGAVEVASCNALLVGLGRQGNFEKMDLLMSEMKKVDIHPNAVTVGIRINHLCKNRRVDEALEVLKRMKGEGGEGDEVLIEPDVITYNTVIDGLCKVGRQEEGLGLMEKMKLEGKCKPTTATYNCLIDGFCKAGEIDRSLELFDDMAKEKISPNVVTMNTLVDGMCKNGRISSAIEFFHEMQKKGFRGNAVTYTTLIKAFCSTNNIDKAINLFNEMTESKITLDAIVYNTLISGLNLAGRFDDATDIATKCKEVGFGLDITFYNTILSGYCKKNELEKVYETIKEMEDTGVKADTVTYNTLISYFSKQCDFKTACTLMKKMTEEGLVPTVVTYGALIHAYCINEKLDEAMKIFRDMNSSSRISPNTVIYNILIDNLCKNNDVETAISLVDDMKLKSVSRNTSTYNAMFKGLQEKNLLEKAFELMDSMTEAACDPDHITMKILNEWLSVVGETDKLKKFVQGYEVSASSETIDLTMSK